MLVYWEMTQACGLACKHCRAAAMPSRHPLELTTAASKSFLNQLKEQCTYAPGAPALVILGPLPSHNWLSATKVSEVGARRIA